MSEITEQDGELLIDGKPVDFQAPWKVEDAIRQLRAEIADITKDRDETRNSFLSVLDERNRADAYNCKLGAEIADLKTAMQRQASAARTLDMSHVARAETMMQHAQVLHDLSSPGELESLREANAILTADIAERDVRIAELEANLTSVRGCFSKASIKRGQAEAELARLRAQGPVAWMWNDMIGIPHTHISPTRPTWPDAGASSAMSVAINVRPLYAEPMPAKSHPDICLTCQQRGRCETNRVCRNKFS